MAYGIDEYGNDLAPPGFSPGVIGTPPGAETRDDAARRYARKRLLAAIGGGLARPAQGGFLGGLAAGFSGAVAAGANQDTLRSQELRDQEKADAGAAREERMRQQWESTFGLQKRQEDRLLARDQREAAQGPQQNIGAIPWYEALPDTDPRKKLYREDATRPPSAGAAADAPVIDDLTLDSYADALATTGAFPALGGFGKYGTQVKMLIGKRAAQKYPGLNVGKVAADYKANQAALSKMTQAKAGLEAFSQTANSNADILLEEANSIPEHGNRPLNAAHRRMAALLGDPHIARFNTALETVVPEFARILQSGGQITGQPLTDTQKKDMRAVLHGDFTRQQLIGSIAILKKEVQNRSAAQEKQISDLQDKITPGSGLRGGAGGGDVEWVMDANGNLVRK